MASFSTTSFFFCKLPRTSPVLPPIGVTKGFNADPTFLNRLSSDPKSMRSRKCGFFNRALFTRTSSAILTSSGRFLLIIAANSFTLTLLAIFFYLKSMSSISSSSPGTVPGLKKGFKETFGFASPSPINAPAF